MSVIPPADTDSVEGVLPDMPKFMRIVVFPEPYRTASTGMLAESAPYTAIFCVSMCDMDSLKDTVRMLLFASYSANDTLGGLVSSYEIAILISSGLVMSWVSFTPPASTTT